MSDSESGARHGAQGDPATAQSVALPPALETAAPDSELVRRREAKLARPRINGVLAHRMERFRELVERQLIKDAKDVAMKDFAFLTDDELERAIYNGKPLTSRQKRVARAWETSKKDAPMALHAAHERVVNALRAQQVQPGVSINVERAVIRVPDTKPDSADDAIVIDVEATLAPG